MQADVAGDWNWGLFARKNVETFESNEAIRARVEALVNLSSICPAKCNWPDDIRPSVLAYSVIVTEARIRFMAEISQELINKQLQRIEDTYHIGDSVLSVLSAAASDKDCARVDRIIFDHVQLCDMVRNRDTIFTSLLRMQKFLDSEAAESPLHAELKAGGHLTFSNMSYGTKHLLAFISSGKFQKRLTEFVDSINYEVDPDSLCQLINEVIRPTSQTGEFIFTEWHYSDDLAV